MSKLLSAVVLAMSMMSVQACGDSALPHPGPDGGAEEVPETYFVGTWDMTRVGTQPLPFFAVPDQIQGETYIINSDHSWTWTRLRQTHDSSTTPPGTKQQTLTNSGTWVVITGEIKGIRLSGTYANTLINPPRAAGLPFEYNVTPLPADNFIQVRVNGQNWEYVKRR
jgi:hypothetical protein